MRPLLSDRPFDGQHGITLIELVVAMAVMIIIILAGTELLRSTVKFERDILESMDAASTEDLLNRRLFADLKYAGLSLNFLIRFDDAEGYNDKSERFACSNLDAIVNESNKSHTSKQIATCDFYLYDPNCREDEEGNLGIGIHHKCTRSITLNANDTYGGLSGKRDFVIITLDSGVKNSAGIRGGGEFFSPDQLFEFVPTNDNDDCKGTTYCDHFKGFSSSANGVGSVVSSGGRYALLSTTVKGRAEETGYPDRYLHYLVESGGSPSKDISLVSKKHLLDYRYAWNYIYDGKNKYGLHINKKNPKSNNALEINFHDEDILGKNDGGYEHYFYRDDDTDEDKEEDTGPDDFLKLVQSYNGEQVDYIARPVRIVRYHLSDALLRAQENGEQITNKMREKLRNADPCLSRYVYHGGDWAGIECQYPGVKSITFSRSVGSRAIRFSIEMESDSEREATRLRKKDAIADES